MFFFHNFGLSSQYEILLFMKHFKSLLDSQWFVENIFTTNMDDKQKSTNLQISMISCSTFQIFEVPQRISPFNIVIRCKLNKLILKNTGLDKITKIATALSGEIVDLDLPPNIIILYKYPLTPCDVERSFSTYKSILVDNRKRFKL